jgi:hypothetical protein
MDVIDAAVRIAATAVHAVSLPVMFPPDELMPF